MKNSRAQTMIEFCFACTVLMLLVFGMIQTVRWIMTDLAERRYDHDSTLTRQGSGIDALEQLNPDFHRPRSIDAALFEKGH